MTTNWNYRIRRIHRYLGVLLGIQFLFWTIGGLYFSWSNMDEIHGDFQKKAPPQYRADLAFVSPSIALSNLKNKIKIDSILNIAYGVFAWWTPQNVPTRRCSNGCFA
jgi:uncharacterized iron-regulated membrane protein